MKNITTIIFLVLSLFCVIYAVENRFIGNGSDWMNSNYWSLKRTPIEWDEVIIIQKNVSLVTPVKIKIWSLFLDNSKLDVLGTLVMHNLTSVNRSELNIGNDAGFFGQIIVKDSDPVVVENVNLGGIASGLKIISLQINGTLTCNSENFIETFKQNIWGSYKNFGKIIVKNNSCCVFSGLPIRNHGTIELLGNAMIRSLDYFQYKTGSTILNIKSPNVIPTILTSSYFYMDGVLKINSNISTHGVILTSSSIGLDNYTGLSVISNRKIELELLNQRFLLMNIN